MADAKGSSSPKSVPNSKAKGHVRLIGGTLKHRRIPVLKRPGLRPTPDRVRETLFNWLTPHLPQACVLEPFAGSGVLSFEAISRGAKFATTNDRDRQSAALLLQNSRALGIEEQVQIFCEDALNLLKHTPKNTFDIVFLDPPYQLNFTETAIALLESYHWLNTEAYIYIEVSIYSFIKIPPHWRLWRQMQAGQVKALLYHRSEPLRS